MIVMKFGGTSVQDVAALKNVSKIIAARIEEMPLVVVSACAGVTDVLIRIAQQAGDGNEESAISDLRQLRDRHIRIIGELLEGAPGTLAQIMQRDFDELERLVRSIVVLRELTPRTLDQVAAYGEVWSSIMLQRALKHQGIRAEWMDARAVMATDDDFTHATPLLDAIRQRSQTILLPAGSPVVRPSTHMGKSNGLVAGVDPNPTAAGFAGRNPGKYWFFANEVPDLPQARDVIEWYLKRGALGVGEVKFNLDCDSVYIERIAALWPDSAKTGFQHNV